MSTTTKRYSGTLAPGAYIATGTDPWLQDAATGEPVDLEAFEAAAERKPETEDVDCECEWSWFPGAFAPVNNAYGIQACDSCDRIPGDLDAAQAIAAHLTTITGKTYEVWFEEVHTTTT